MSWRNQQMLSFIEPVVFKQDQELIDYIVHNSIIEATGVGDIEYFSSHVNFVSGPSLFGIYICNEVFYFEDLVTKVNIFLRESITPNGVLYLAINKFLAIPEKLLDSKKSYDESILTYFTNALLQCDIESYQCTPQDNGSYFNFAHPLTRFYLRRL